MRIQVPLDPRATPAPLCLGDGATAPGHTAFAIDIADSPRAILEPRIALLAAIADYADALAAILEVPKTDVAAELTASRASPLSSRAPTSPASPPRRRASRARAQSR